jgi:LPS export ABC transporter protein LptC
MVPRRFSHLVFVSFFALFVGFYSVSCKNDLADVNRVTSKVVEPCETEKDVTTIYSDSARMKVKLMAPLIEHYIKDTSYVVFNKGIHLIFFDDSLKIKNELTANYAIKYDHLNRMEARNNVVLMNCKGEKLKTEHLIWDQTKKSIYTEADVTILTADETIYGQGLQSNEDFSKYKITKPYGSIGVQEEQGAGNKVK